jgi:hypothetical protein
VYRYFDEARGFGAYFRICRSSFSRAAAPPSSGALGTRGFAYLNVMSPEQARNLLWRINSTCTVSALKKRPLRLVGFRLEETADRAEILASVLTDSVDQYLTGYFGSEYLVHWMTCTATAPSARGATVSFRWHCDKGPRTHIKLIVYLNGSEEHGGNTEFVPLDDSRAVADQGYLFGRVRFRTPAVSDLAAVAGRPITAHQRPITAGEGVLFQPATVLHRGVTPRRGTRYVITLCLLPSPVPWRDALARGAITDLAVDDKWPRHAMELLRVLRPGAVL